MQSSTHAPAATAPRRTEQCGLSPTGCCFNSGALVLPCITLGGMVILVMGVSGSGKSTIGEALAQRLGGRFEDSDPYHPQTNRDKMASGQALNDNDRRPWLEILAQNIAEWDTEDAPVVLACSALKRSYRDLLRSVDPDLIVVHLNGSHDLIFRRMSKRIGHFMPPELLNSQFEALELPGQSEDDPAILVDIDDDVEGVVDATVQKLRNAGHLPA